MKKPFYIVIIFGFLLLPFSFALALTTGYIYTDSVGNTNYNFSDGTSGYSYKDSAGYTHYQFSDGLYGNIYTDITGATHYYFDSLQKNKYVGGACPFSFNYTCIEESQYQEMYNNAAQGLPSCNQTSGESGSFSVSAESCTPEGKERLIMSGIYGPRLKMCREHIDLYKIAKVNYDKCIQDEDAKWEKYAQAKLDLLKRQADLLFQTTNTSCPAKSSANSSGNCVCDSGLVWNKQQTQCIECEKVYINTHYENINGKGGCYCDNGYNYSSITATCDRTTSIFSDKIEVNQNENIVILNNEKKDNTLEEEKKLSQNEDKKMSEKLSGRILLQVEKNGEGWYLNPGDKKKYYLGRPADAFNAMRNLGLGIKHDELAKYLNSKFPDRLSGKIMLDVEQNGEAYYINPTNLKGYFLNRPADAFKVMRELGLGISNNDVRKIIVGEVK